MQNEATKLIVQSHFSLAVSLILMSCTAVLYLTAEIVVDLGEVKELQTKHDTSHPVKLLRVALVPSHLMRHMEVTHSVL